MNECIAVQFFDLCAATTDNFDLGKMLSRARRTVKVEFRKSI